MNKDEKTGARAVDVTDYQRNALDLPVDLNAEVAQDLRYSRTIDGPPATVPKLHDQPSPYEVFGSFDKAKSLQKARLQPRCTTASVRTQEGEVVLRESTQGEGYNTEKFLQTNKLSKHARNEPLTLMSHENQDILRVYPATDSNEEGVPGIRRPLVPYEKELPNLQRPGTCPEDRTNIINDPYPLENRPSSELHTRGVLTPKQSYSLPVKLDRSEKLSKRYGMHASDQFASKASNFMGGGSAPPVLMMTPSHDQYPIVHVDMTYKNDERFQWKPGCGVPRPQTSLLAIQDSFTKSAVRKKFLQRFPENLPDLRENILKGKKHTFGSMNSQILRGTPMVDVM